MTAFGRRLVLVLVVAAAAAVAAGSARATRPLMTGVYEPQLAAGADGQIELARIRAAGATVVRIGVDWSALAPAAPAQADDPEDPAYQWATLDDHVGAAAAAGLQPLLTIMHAPPWASVPGAPPSHPRAAALTAFATAIAQRYAGGASALPRVRYWMLWNEPNLNEDLTPQFSGRRPVSPAIYRTMVNAFAAGIKSVSPSNLVIAGGLAPYGIQKEGQPIDKVLSVAPMIFLRDLLCISAGTHPRPTCKTKVAFDAFSVHPYTWGGPTHSAFSPDDVAIGDLPEVKQTISSAWRLGRIRARSAPQLWVTEFGWDTNPPDPKAIPTALQARWTSEALYRMWSDGVSLITWFLLRDMPLSSSPFQSGLYLLGSTLADDRPKPTLTAFRFPFVALPHGTSTLVWGRTPTSRAGMVRIQRRSGSGWSNMRAVRAGRGGVFEAVLPFAGPTGYLRARVGTSSSLPFGLAPVPDRRISPFG